MGYYASGDTRKMLQSSEDDEGYENQTPITTISIGLLNQSDVRSKQHFVRGISQEISPTPIPPVTDDTDRPFWAEDELSNSESRQQLNEKQKRRYSLSYRNRITVHRSRSLLFKSSSSSLDSISEQISLRVSKQKQLTDWRNTKQPGYSNSEKKYTRKKGAFFSINEKSVCARSKNCNQMQVRKHPFLINRKFRH